MNLKILFGILFLSSFTLFSQENIVKNNTLSFESGIFHHGLYGIGYDRNIVLRNSCFISVHGSAGAGPDFVQSGKNQYYSLAPTFNFGKKYIYFSIGPQLKYVRQRRSILKGEFIWTIPDNVVYKGLGIGGLMGLNFFSNIGITGKIQVGLTYLPEFVGVNKLTLGTGISIGYNFGRTS